MSNINTDLFEDLFKFKDLIIFCEVKEAYNPSNKKLMVENLNENYETLNALKIEYYEKYALQGRDENIWYEAMEELNSIAKKLEDEVGKIEIDKELKREIKKCLNQMQLNKNKQTPFCNLLVLLKQIKKFDDATSEVSLKNLTQKEIELINLNKTANERKKATDEIEHVLLQKMYTDKDSAYELNRKVICYFEAVFGRNDRTVEEVKKFRIKRKLV
jgi:hypothetical protein